MLCGRGWFSSLRIVSFRWRGMTIFLLLSLTALLASSTKALSLSSLVNRPQSNMNPLACCFVCGSDEVWLRCLVSLGGADVLCQNVLARLQMASQRVQQRKRPKLDFDLQYPGLPHAGFCTDLFEQNWSQWSYCRSAEFCMVS